MHELRTHRGAGVPGVRSPRAVVEALALTGVVVVAFARFASPLFASGHPADEALYFAGFARYAAGSDPNVLPNALVTPAFARLGSALVALAGERGAAIVLRALTALGIGAIAWLSTLATERGLRLRVALATAAVLLYPPFAHAMEFGNVGPLATALALAALVLLPRRPKVAASALGVSLAVKPIALAVLPAVLPRKAGWRGKGPPPGLLAAALAVAIAGALVLAAGPELLLRFSERSARIWGGPFQLGLVRALTELGLELPTWLPIALIGGVAWLWIRRDDPPDPLFLAVAPALALAASPIVWLHTLALSLPVQLRALFGPHAFRAGVRQPLELAFRVALVATTWGAGAAGAIDRSPAAIRAAVAALPLVSVLVLTARTVADEPPADRR